MEQYEATCESPVFSHVNWNLTWAMLDCHLLGENTGENIKFTWKSTIDTKFDSNYKIGWSVYFYLSSLVKGREITKKNTFGPPPPPLLIVHCEGFRQTAMIVNQQTLYSHFIQDGGLKRLEISQKLLCVFHLGRGNLYVAHYKSSQLTKLLAQPNFVCLLQLKLKVLKISFLHNLHPLRCERVHSIKYIMFHTFRYVHHRWLYKIYLIRK